MNGLRSFIDSRRCGWFVVILLAFFCGCESSSSLGRVKTEVKTRGTDEICVLDVRDMPLRQVVDAIEVFLEKSIALDPSVDPERNIESVHVEEDDWMAVLNKFAEEEGLFVKEAETDLVLTATQPSAPSEDKK